MSALDSPLPLVEYGEPVPLPDVEPGTVDQLVEHGEAWKKQLGLSHSPFCIGERNGMVTISARDVAGFLRIGDLDVEVAPKFLSGPAITTGRWRAALWRILAATDDDPLLAPPTIASDEPTRTISDLMGWSFLASMTAARLRGMPRGYTERRGQLPVLRGRIDVSRTADMVLHPYRLHCVYDVYSEDIAVNRLLRWAAQALARDVLSPRLTRALQGEVAALEGVGGVPPGLLEAERLVLPPQYRQLEPAVRIARLLLRGHSLVHRRGTEGVHGFLWKSADVFERFVFRLVRRVSRQVGGLYVKKQPVGLGTPDGSGGRAFRTEPDVRISDNARTRIVLDAKYKTWAGHAPKREDRYQVIVGGWVVSCDFVGLVYPSLDGERQYPLSWSLHGPAAPSKMVSIFVNLIEMADKRGERRLLSDLRQDLAPYL